MSAVSKAEAHALPVGLVYPAKASRDAKRQAKRELNKAIAKAVWNSVVDREKPTVDTSWPEGESWVQIPVTEFMTILDDPKGLAGPPPIDLSEIYHAEADPGLAAALFNDDVKGGV